MMMETASLGKPTVSRTMTRVTRPACGIPAAPMLAAVAVIEMMITWFGIYVRKCHQKLAKTPTCPSVGFIPVICAMKMAATAS